MYIVLTDGQVVAQSRIVKNTNELDELNRSAKVATAGNWWWEKGSNENYTRPKDNYKHVEGKYK